MNDFKELTAQAREAFDKQIVVINELEKEGKQREFLNSLNKENVDESKLSLDRTLIPSTGKNI